MTVFTTGARVPPPPFVSTTLSVAGAGPLAIAVNGTLSREVANAGLGCTVISAVAVLPPAVALTVAAPVVSPIATPVADSEIAASLVAQRARASAKRRPVRSIPIARSRRVSSTTITAVAGST